MPTIYEQINADQMTNLLAAQVQQAQLKKKLQEAKSGAPATDSPAALQQAALANTLQLQRERLAASSQSQGTDLASRERMQGQQLGAQSSMQAAQLAAALQQQRERLSSAEGQQRTQIEGSSRLQTEKAQQTENQTKLVSDLENERRKTAAARALSLFRSSGSTLGTLNTAGAMREL